jgi:hypothetical protein
MIRNLLVPHYPEILLPQKSYPALSNADVRENTLVRETPADVYSFLNRPGYENDDIIHMIVAPQPSLREVFELSLFLYGYYTEDHIGIRVTDKILYADWTADQDELSPEGIAYSQEAAYPLFLAAAQLDNQQIDYNSEALTLSFTHKPTCANYWHFELWVKDGNGNWTLPH